MARDERGFMGSVAGVTVHEKPYPRGPLGPNPDNDKVVSAAPGEPTVQERALDLHDAVQTAARRSHIERMRRAVAVARSRAERAPPAHREVFAGDLAKLEAELAALGEP